MATGQAVPKGVELMERLKRLLAYSSRDAAVIARIREEALILWPTDPGQARAQGQDFVTGDVRVWGRADDLEVRLSRQSLRQDLADDG